MRGIKFRAWEKNLKEMISVDSINFEAGLINMELAWRTFEEIELMQYTGLKDKKGVEIYEGDIVKSFSNINKYTDDFAENVEPTYYFSEIVYHNGCFKNTYKGKPSSPLNWTEATKSHNLEVVGNIYENTELLEV